jgi:spore maturation protein CgeB
MVKKGANNKENRYEERDLNINRAINSKVNYWDKKVLYIYPIHGATYTIINQAIIDQLKSMVNGVYAASAEEDVVSLSSQLKPDLVFVLQGDTFPIQQVNAIKDMGILTAIWFTDDPYVIDITKDIAPYYHFVFTQELNCVSYYQKLGCLQVHYLPLAVNTKVFQYQKKIEKKPIDVCFMGAGWNNRISLFDELAPYLAKINSILVGSLWDRMNNYHLLSDKIRFGFLPPEESSYLINESKIVINNHRAHDDSTLFSLNSNKMPALSVNPRTFEISACCAFQLTDVRKELHRYFEVGKEIVTYSSSTDLREKIKYYLAHEEERKKIAQRAYIKTLKHHTYAQRIAFLLKVIFG